MQRTTEIFFHTRREIWSSGTTPYDYPVTTIFFRSTVSPRGEYHTYIHCSMYDTLQLYVYDIASTVYLQPRMTRRSTIIDLIISYLKQRQSRSTHMSFPTDFSCSIGSNSTFLREHNNSSSLLLACKGNKTWNGFCNNTV